MSYSHGHFSETFLPAVDLTTIGDQGVWVPLGLPVTMRRFAALVTAAVGTPAARLSLDVRPTAGSDTGRLATGEIVLPSGSPAGRVVYREVSPLYRLLMPGQELVVYVLATSSAGVCAVRFVYEVVPEIPANNARMLASV